MYVEKEGERLEMYCQACGAELPQDAIFCFKCGKRVTSPTGSAAQNPPSPQVVAPSGVTSLKCPSCGAPIAPKFGEMVISCEYCGNAIALGVQGWTNIQKQTMLPLKIENQESLNSIIKPMMDKGLLHRHLQENSTQEEMNLSFVPYWIVSVSACTSIVTVSEAQVVGQTAAEAAVWAVILGGMGGGRRAYWNYGRRLPGIPSPSFFRIGSVMAFGMGYGSATKQVELDENYNFPVVALKTLAAYQPRDYQFDLSSRMLFDFSKIPKNIKVLNGDIGEDVAKDQARTLVSQLQADKAHSKYHMIQQIATSTDVGEAELLHAPIWFVKYDHKGNKIILVFDANSGRIINAMGL